MPFGQQKGEVGADARECAADGRGLQALILEIVNELAKMRRGERSGFFDADAFRVRDEPLEITAVGFERARRDATLELQVIAEFF